MYNGRAYDLNANLYGKELTSLCKHQFKELEIKKRNRKNEYVDEATSLYFRACCLRIFFYLSANSSPASFVEILKIIFSINQKKLHEDTDDLEGP